MSNARVALRSGVVLAVLSLTVLGCGEEPKVPPELIGFSPASASVKANETLKIKVEYQKNDYELESFQWTAEAGAIEGNGQAEITYQAPDVAGDYELTVTAAYADDEGAEVLLATMVEVLPADEPAAAAEPTPTRRRQPRPPRTRPQLRKPKWSQKPTRRPQPRPRQAPRPPPTRRHRPRT